MCLLQRTPLELEHPGPCIDPRISPNGELVAYVHDRSLFVVAKIGAPELILEADSEDSTYGLADFIAAEELERHRGFWWLADSSGLLVEKYDESTVQVQWIADPASPTAEPVPHRYPAAGTANPIISLYLAKLGSAPVQLEWDAERFPYLATVSASTAVPLISVLNRAQTTSVIFEVDTDSGSLIERETREQLPWITLFPGVPALDSAGRLIEVIPDGGDFRLHRDGIPLSPPGVQVDAVLDIDSDIFLSIQNDPTTSDLALIDETGGFTQMTDGTGWHGGIRKGALTLISRADLATTTSRVTVNTQSEDLTIESNAEVSIVSPKVQLREVGAQHLRATVLAQTFIR